MNSRIIKVALLLIAFCVYGSASFSQKNTLKDAAWKDFLNLDHYLIPFWEADTIYDEVVQPIRDSNTLASGRLLYKAKRVLSVKDASLQKEYLKNNDWIYKDGIIIIPERSAAPYFYRSELVFKNEKPGSSKPGKISGEHVLHDERGLLQSRQLAVTYIKHRNSRWQGPVPEFSDAILPGSLAKLRDGRNFKIVFYGNSIETGANSSSFINKPPFLPTWPEMVVYRLRKEYGDKINYQNMSVGGTLASWGKENSAKLIIPENPDLVIIGFGMNDGTQLVEPEVYSSHIRSIMDSVLANVRDCEFIVIAPMLANPLAVHNQKQPLYKYELYKMNQKGIAVADMTTIHQELLKHKAYQDMTGNNINHPNDYLARWYAMTVTGFLIR